MSINQVVLSGRLGAEPEISNLKNGNRVANMRLATEKNWKKPEVKHNVPTPWQWMVSYPENLTILNHVDIGAFTYIQAEAGVELHDDVEIGSHCAIFSVNSINN